MQKIIAYYWIIKFSASGQKFYQSRIQIEKNTFYCENFFSSIVEAGDNARDFLKYIAIEVRQAKEKYEV